MLIGFGYDSHRLVAGRDLVLGGVKIPFAKGLLGHSDADVLVHAITDALIGALGLGDIGAMFPDTDTRFRNIDSGILLAEVVAIAEKQGFTVNNIDSSVVMEAPRLAPFIATMRAQIAKIAAVDVARVNVKAKTNEGMGFIGRGEGIAAFAVVTIVAKGEKKKR